MLPVCMDGPHCVSLHCCYYRTLIDTKSQAQCICSHMWSGNLDLTADNVLASSMVLPESPPAALPQGWAHRGWLIDQFGGLLPQWVHDVGRVKGSVKDEENKPLVLAFLGHAPDG